MIALEERQKAEMEAARQARLLETAKAFDQLRAVVHSGNSYSLLGCARNLLRLIDEHNANFQRERATEARKTRDVEFIDMGGKRFHHEHSQWYDDCQLITAINAAIFLGLPTLSPFLDADTYKMWAKYTKTVYPLNSIDERRIARMHRYLRLRTIDVPVSLPKIRQQLNLGYPIELSLQLEEDDECSHSALIVDIAQKKVRATNLVDTENGWIEWPSIREYAMWYAEKHTDRKIIGRVYKPIGRLPRAA